jgi:hypothetical protein
MSPEKRNKGGRKGKAPNSSDELPTKQRITLALAAIDTGMTLQKAAKIYRIARSILSDRKNGAKTKVEASAKI